MAEVGSAYVSLLPSARGFGSKMQSAVGPQIDSTAKRTGSRFGKVFAYATMGPLRALGGAALGFFAFNAIKNVIGGTIEEAREAAVVTARTENVIKSMGNAAKISADGVASLAMAISNKTAIDDEAIQSGQNLLLTFGNISNKVDGEFVGTFNRASYLMADMSKALGQDMKSSALQLGKALNDPIKGVTALSRVGVSFTEQQKEQIKNFVEGGRLAEAQGVILDELGRQFGGAAAAMATPADRAKVAFANLKEEIGTRLLPFIDQFLTGVTAQIPRVSAALDTIGPAISRVISFVRPLVGEVLTSLATLVTGSLIPALTNLYVAIQPALSEAFSAFKTALAVIGVALGHLGPLLVSTTAFVAQHKTAITAIAVTVGTAVVAWKIWQGAILAWTAITKAAAAVQAAFNVVLAANPIGLTVIAIAALAAGLIYAYKHSATFRGIVDKLWAAIKVAAGWVADIAGKLRVLFGAAVNVAIGLVGGFIGRLVALGRAVVDRVKDFGEFLVGVKNKIGEALAFVQSIPDKIKAAFVGAATWLISAGADIIRGLINGIRSMAASAAAAARDAVQGAINAAKDLLKIGSPSKVFHELGMWSMVGFAKGIEDNAPKVLDKLEALRDGLKGQIDQIKSDMASLASSVASAFTGNLFDTAIDAAATVGDRMFTALGGRPTDLPTDFADNVDTFIGNLLDTKGELKRLKKAFKKLVKWGLDPAFLAQLFQSGNGGLILDLASGTKDQAQEAASLFGDVQSLSSSLGNQVAREKLGPKLDGLRDELKDVKRAIKLIGKDVAKALDNAAAKSQRGAA